ncbi:response regulator receiver modulated diguanylate cyclase [Anaeromyxobacter dehalogenans 2CP-C]|uniref:diguanylate cyclase n=1 Tax=Anaeromyxobacter dehalogenans (strain 2CP-C) TaxID=290397 RepID=Q2II51_ANADE|nr:response regulator receiver modulated diguanylate cyclase [Anaeromyxobacter dehalogenans 2CP-C]
MADDEADAREVLAQVLAPEYDVASASDGQEALDLARAEHPDVVLLDIAMPRLDGFEVLERLRHDPATADIPVIFVSGRGDDAVKVRSLDLGAVDYLQKPFSERELRARVERTLRLVRSQSALRELAQTDALTGLANLRAFRARVEEEVKRARRYRTPLTCVMADMDNLKPINDELGHAAGDRAIAAVAAVIREELRETDFGARYGGDEFVILLPHTSGEEGRVFAERVCTRLHETVLEVSGERVALGASFGVACLPEEDGDDGADALVRAADAALYVAKRAGRGRVSLAAPEPRASASAG